MFDRLDVEKDAGIEFMKGYIIMKQGHMGERKGPGKLGRIVAISVLGKK